MRIERATFGNVGGMHNLLASSLPRDSLPAALGGRTDKPPGQLQAGVVWSPLVGCAPMEAWWVLWRSAEDPTTGRGGMVRTQVALVRREDVGGLPSLDPLLNALTEDSSQAQPLLLDDPPMGVQPPHGPPPAWFGSLIRLLLEGRYPVVIPEVPALETTLRALWPRLWPAARRTLSARVAFDPDFLGTQPESWWLVATPGAFATRWEKFPRVNRAEAAIAPTSDPEAWFLGQASPPFQALMVELGDLAPELTAPRRVARVLELARDLDGANPTADMVVALLRELGQLSTKSGGTLTLKTRAVEVLTRQLPTAGPTTLLGLANVPLGLPPEAQARLSEVVAWWVETRLPEVPDKDALRLLNRLQRQGFERWWLGAVASGLARALAPPSSSWARALFRWWSQTPEALSTLEGMLPAAPEVEASLEAALPTSLPQATGEAVLGLARRRGWSSLHGALLSLLRAPRNAIQEQRAFPGDPLPGLARLCARLPGDSLVAAAVEESWALLLQEVAKRTVERPEFLAPLDPALPGWRELWKAHLAAGGEPWGGIPQPERVFHGLLDLLLKGEAIHFSLMEALASTRAGHALHHPRRAELWTVLPSELRAALLRSTSRAWLEAFISGEELERPEVPLAAKVLDSADSVLQPPVRAHTLTELLECFPEVGEEEASLWLNRLDKPLYHLEAERLGKLIAKRRWKQMAGHAFDMRRTRDDLNSLLHHCRDLLSFWERFWLGGKARPSQSESLMEVARLGAERYPDGPDFLWQRAGGSAGDLQRHGTGKERWQYAVEKAHQGALKHGVAGLLKAMHDDFPHTKELRELLRVFERS